MAKKTVKKAVKKTVTATVKKAVKKVAKKTVKRVPKKIEYSPRDFAIKAARIAEELHCTDIVVLDLAGRSPATDFFVIATGTSDRQMRTVADDVSEAGRLMDYNRFGRAGYEQGRWILLDFVNVVLHLFDQEYRSYYDLELLWGDAKRVDWKK